MVEEPTPAPVPSSSGSDRFSPALVCGSVVGADRSGVDDDDMVVWKFKLMPELTSSIRIGVEVEVVVVVVEEVWFFLWFNTNELRVCAPVEIK